MSVKKSGDWSKLGNRLFKLIANLPKAVPLVRSESAKGRVIMQSIAPVRTGFLRDNIVDNPIPDGAEIHSRAGYSGFQEYGTSRMGAQPFFRPGLTEAWVKIHDGLIKLWRK